MALLSAIFVLKNTFLSYILPVYQYRNFDQTLSEFDQIKLLNESSV